MKWLDLPPVWTAACAAVAWGFYVPVPWGPLPAVGAVVLVIAVVLVAAAVREFARSRTTVIPHRVPTALISGGVFRLSRNPIYLADLLFVAGFSLIWGSLIGLILVPVLAVVLVRRFIVPEEVRLEAAFGDDWRRYAASVRRWL